MLSKAEVKRAVWWKKTILGEIDYYVGRVIIYYIIKDVWISISRTFIMRILAREVICIWSLQQKIGYVSSWNWICSGYMARFCYGVSVCLQGRSVSETNSEDKRFSVVGPDDVMGRGVAMMLSCQNPRATSSSMIPLYKTFQCRWIVGCSIFQIEVTFLPSPHPLYSHCPSGFSLSLNYLFITWRNKMKDIMNGLIVVDRQVPPKIEWVGYLNRTQCSRMHVHHIIRQQRRYSLFFSLFTQHIPYHHHHHTYNALMEELSTAAVAAAYILVTWHAFMVCLSLLGQYVG